MSDPNCTYHNIASRKLLLCLVFHFSFTFTASFVPQDKFFINCGGTAPAELPDGRVFQPDSPNSNPLVTVPTNSVVFTAANKSQSGSTDLYSSARVFTRSSVYAISPKQNSSGQHWLRLHFLPLDNELRSAVFSVKVNGVTLLHRFSFSSNSSRLVVKEFVVTNLSIELSPARGSVAFLSAIEAISVPEKQYPLVALSVGPIGSLVRIPIGVGFETVYRVNIGGPLITPKNDSIWRTWEPDFKYLVNSVCANSVVKDPGSVKYNGKDVSELIAPSWVYSSAQEMADAHVISQRFNISWEFEVQSGFGYLIRLHFCDIVSVSPGSLVFNVYVNERIGLDSFDISTKTGVSELSTPCFVDFFVEDEGKDRILVQVGPSELSGSQPNAILNGLEIIKVIDYSKSSTSKRKVLFILVACCVLVFGALVVLLLVAIKMLKTKPKDRPRRGQLSTSRLSDSKLSIGSSANSLGRVFSFSEIRDATNGFDESLVIGVGGFGRVYRGLLGDGSTVAVKRGNPRSTQGLTEFRTEIEMLTRLRHRHLVSLIGYCEELDEMILVYEYMAGGPLRRHLYGGPPDQSRHPLTWDQRLDICIGAAKGLHYLHTGAAGVIIHRDVKTTNILLDENMSSAKVADFGLSKLGPALDQTHVSTAVKGSFGYLDPEYYRRQRLTEKSDVYSFGVVLLEVLCARPAINPALPREEVNIAEWAMSWQRRGKLDRVIDPTLVGSITVESLRKFGDTAEKCLAECGTERPTMGDVLWNLEYALQLHQVASMQPPALENSSNHIPEISMWHLGLESDGDAASGHESDAMSTAVFSQLIDPKGR